MIPASFIGKLHVNQFNVINLRFLSKVPFSFKGTFQDEPELCRTMSGEMVPYPKGRRNKLFFPIYEYGAKAVSLDLNSPDKETERTARLYSQAKHHYLVRRDQLLKGGLLGKWMAVGSGGQTFLADTEEEVRNVAEMLFPIGDDEYYAECIGKEILCAINMK